MCIIPSLFLLSSAPRKTLQDPVIISSSGKRSLSSRQSRLYRQSSLLLPHTNPHLVQELSVDPCYYPIVLTIAPTRAAYTNRVTCRAPVCLNSVSRAASTSCVQVLLLLTCHFTFIAFYPVMFSCVPYLLGSTFSTTTHTHTLEPYFRPPLVKIGQPEAVSSVTQSRLLRSKCRQGLDQLSW